MKRPVLDLDGKRPRRGGALGRDLCRTRARGSLAAHGRLAARQASQRLGQGAQSRRDGLLAAQDVPPEGHRQRSSRRPAHQHSARRGDRPRAGSAQLRYRSAQARAQAGALRCALPPRLRAATSTFLPRPRRGRPRPSRWPRRSPSSVGRCSLAGERARRRQELSSLRAQS